MATETELKLEVAPQACAFLEGSDLLSGTPSIVKQRAVYFDTPENTLLSNGISLRIRRAGRKRLQTMKISAGPAAGIFDRTEIECPVRTDELTVDPDGPLAQLLGKGTKALAPKFEISVERHAWMLKEGLSDIELVIDRGSAKAFGREVPISECELELKSGDRADLFRLARKLDAIAPVRLGLLSKSERGYGLLGPAVAAHKADAITLDRESSAEQAFRQIALSCLRQYRANEDLLLEASQPAALHQARVALRRLRSAFTIFKPVIPVADAQRFKNELRSLSAILGEARDLDVLRDRLSAGPIEKIEDARAVAYAKVEAQLRSDHVRAVMIDLAAWLFSDNWGAGEVNGGRRGQSAFDHASQALGRQRKRIRKHGRKLRSGSDDERHTVRKDAKKLRYASEFFRSLFDGKGQRRRQGKFGEVLETLQDQLGSLNDRATAKGLIEALDLNRRDGIDHLFRGPEKAVRLKRAEAAWDDLVDLKPFWK